LVESCEFVVIFVVFLFETSAFRYYAGGGVGVFIMGSASISSIFLGRVLLLDAITAYGCVGATLAFSGFAVFFGADLQQGFTVVGAALASFAG
ncbi:EamA/RhaT family transporter, partial [Pseudomonas syringae pv. tagetis]